MGRESKRKKRKKENRTECDSNELTIYNEEIDDRSHIYRCLFSLSLSLARARSLSLKHIEEEEEKRQHIDFNNDSSLFSI